MTKYPICAKLLFNTKPIEVFSMKMKDPKETETLDPRIEKTIEECSILVGNILGQTDLPNDKKIESSLQVIIEEASRLKIPLETQALLMATVVDVVIIPYLVEQKCSKCQGGNPIPDIPTNKDKSVGGMFA